MIVGLAVSIAACASTHTRDKPKPTSRMDAGLDAGRPDGSPAVDAAVGGDDSGPDRAAADGGQNRRYKLQRKSSCQLFPQAFVAERSWAVARCGGQADQHQRLLCLSTVLRARGVLRRQLTSVRPQSSSRPAIYGAKRSGRERRGENPDDTRLVSLNGGATVHLAKVPSGISSTSSLWPTLAL